MDLVGCSKRRDRGGSSCLQAIAAKEREALGDVAPRVSVRGNLVGDKKEYFLLKTAFVVKPHKKKEFERDWKAHQALNG